MSGISRRDLLQFRFGIFGFFSFGAVGLGAHRRIDAGLSRSCVG